ncbi:MAG: HAD family hydrolase [Ignavibacteria bacterium]|jgi:putative hydrolase of the HAD superfamily
MYKDIETIIFDFGGTLDTNGIPWSQKYLITLKINGFVFDDKLYHRIYKASEEFLQNNSNNNFRSYKELMKEQLSFIISSIHLTGYENRHNYERIINEVFADIWMDTVYCIKNSKEILETFKNKYKLGLVSNYYGNIKRICKDMDLDKYFDVILDPNTACIHKPHPGIFSIALKMLNSLPENTFVIGDSYEDDIVPAKIIGCRTILLNRNIILNESKYDSSDYTVKNINKIQSILQKK